MYHIINCSITPFCPDKWQILSPTDQIPTRFQGSLKWDKAAQKEMFYLSEKQTTGDKRIEGNNLREELTDKLVVVLPANVLDYLLANTHLIPEEWKHKAVFFWGTIYCHPGGEICIRCLNWRHSMWCWNIGWLDDKFCSDDLAALPASQN